MKVENLVPEVYYAESRDFAFIGRLIEIAFNYMKTTADCLVSDLDAKGGGNANIVDLLSHTLGFELKHEYITKDLIYVASAFTYLLRHKGTKEAILTAVRLLLNSQGIKETLRSDFVTIRNFEIEIKVPENLIDLVLLEDIFDYILPAGFTYKFTTVNSFKTQLTQIVNVDSSAQKLINVPDTITAEIRSTGTAQELNGAAEFDSGIGTIYTGTTINGE